MYTKDPSVKTAEFNAEKEWSPGGITEPKYFFIKSGCFWIASPIEQKIIPSFSNSPLYVVATETLSNTTSTATPAKTFCSSKGIPNLLYVSISFGSTSLRFLGFFLN